MITVCFRCDDPSVTSDHLLERRILELFAHYKVPLCVAPVPFKQTTDRGTVPLSPQHMAHLIEAQRAGLVDIALHGHSHIPRSADSNGLNSEFFGLPLSQQSSLVQEGLSHLKTVFPGRIDGFVPPWNSYDANTAQAIFEAGLHYLSASWQIYNYDKLAIVPRTCSLKNARQAIEAAIRVAKLDPVVVVVMHPDEFAEYRDPPAPDEPPPFTSLPALKSLLNWIVNATPVTVSSIREVAEGLKKTGPLWTPHDLTLPYSIKEVTPKNMLLRGSKVTAVARMMLLKLGQKSN